ncbi:MAG: hypothetical protein M9962_11500 [Oligoflexia bacterium]|nr:hypothetical protein [Oligoflexia bacterium]
MKIVKIILLSFLTIFLTLGLVFLSNQYLFRDKFFSSIDQFFFRLDFIANNPKLKNLKIDEKLDSILGKCAENFLQTALISRSPPYGPVFNFKNLASIKCTQNDAVFVILNGNLDKTLDTFISIKRLYSGGFVVIPVSGNYHLLAKTEVKNLNLVIGNYLVRIKSIKPKPDIQNNTTINIYSDKEPPQIILSGGFFTIEKVEPLNGTDTKLQIDIYPTAELIINNNKFTEVEASLRFENGRMY